MKELISGGLMIAVIGGIGFFIYNGVSGVNKTSTAQSLAKRMLHNEHLDIDPTDAAIVSASAQSGANGSSISNVAPAAEGGEGEAAAPSGYPANMDGSRSGIASSPLANRMRYATGGYANSGSGGSAGQQNPYQQRQSSESTDSALDSMGR